MSSLVPIVIERGRDGERSYDLFSRMMKDRIIFLTGPIHAEIASSIVAQLLFLEKEDEKSDIIMYINSPGGVIYDGLAIIDTMKYIKPDVVTVAVGTSASMGTMILSSGTKGKRFALPNSLIHIHQPLGGVEGQASDIEITAHEILRLKKLLTDMLLESTGQDRTVLERDMDRDKNMTAQEAKEYGIIDQIITSSKALQSKPKAD